MGPVFGGTEYTSATRYWPRDLRHSQSRAEGCAAPDTCRGRRPTGKQPGAPPVPHDTRGCESLRRRWLSVFQLQRKVEFEAPSLTFLIYALRLRLRTGLRQYAI